MREHSDADAKHPLRVHKPGALIALPLFGLWLLLVSQEPSVGVQSPPTAQSVKLAREAIEQLQGAPGETSGHLLLNNEMLDGLSSLAGDVSGVRRIEAQIGSGKLVIAMSIPLPANQWLNTSIAVSGHSKGFPDLSLGAGRLQLPLWAGRPVAELARWMLGVRGVDLPPLDGMIQSFRVTKRQLSAEVTLPARTGIIDRVITARGVDLDESVVAGVYCGLAARQSGSPTDQLAVQVQRAFEEAPIAGSEAYNRAALVAVALFVVGKRAEPLAPKAIIQTGRCKRGQLKIVLSKRADVAKHWALSAALTAVVGDSAASSLGEWKELSDSLPRGSGFSFLDLAADRAGLHTARRALNPVTAASTAKELAMATDQQLFPISLLAAQEGLSEEEFLKRYGNVDAANYRPTMRWIDR